MLYEGRIFIFHAVFVTDQSNWILLLETSFIRDRNPPGRKYKFKEYHLSGNFTFFDPLNYLKDTLNYL